MASKDSVPAPIELVDAINGLLLVYFYWEGFLLVLMLFLDGGPAIDNFYWLIFELLFWFLMWRCASDVY